MFIYIKFECIKCGMIVRLYVIYYYKWNYIVYIIFECMYFVVRIIFLLNDKCI